MSTGKEKNNLNILSGFLRSRCMYRTTSKFLVHHLFFKTFSWGVLPNTPVRTRSTRSSSYAYILYAYHMYHTELQLNCHTEAQKI